MHLEEAISVPRNETRYDEGLGRFGRRPAVEREAPEGLPKLAQRLEPTP